jgi:hypothetical protein
MFLIVILVFGDNKDLFKIMDVGAPLFSMVCTNKAKVGFGFSLGTAGRAAT